MAGDAATTPDIYHVRHARDLILAARIPFHRQCSVARHRRSARGAVIINAAVGWDENSKNPIVALSGAGISLRRLPDVENLLAQGAKGPEIEKTVLHTIQPEPQWTGSAAFRAYLAAVSIADCVAACRQGKVLACE